MTAERLETSWQETAAHAEITAPSADVIFQALCRRYSEPGRAYHTLEHIAVMLNTVSEFRDTLHDDVAVRLAVWFHDAVYDSRRSDNEEQSALYAMSVLRWGGATPSLLPLVERFILATKTHQSLSHDTDCKFVLDADLAILGASAVDYDRYARAIRQEYAWVSEEDYRAGRRKVLAGFLGRDRLYHTPLLSNRLEQAARGNLQREIRALS